MQGKNKRRRGGKRVTENDLPHSLSTAEVKIARAETKNKKHLVRTSKMSCKCLSEL